MSDLKIQLDSPSEVYTTGQQVTGNVLLKSKDPIKANFLKICIHGEAHTKWYQEDHVPYISDEGEREFDNQNVKYSGREVYLSEDHIAWASSDGKDRIPGGTHVFPFSFTLPTDCPPSLEGWYGHIRYSVHVELDRPWKLNKKSKKLFSVVPVYDLNLIPTAINPMINSASMKTGILFRKGQISMTANLPKRGYVPGEIVPITLNIDNDSSNRVTKIDCNLLQLTHFHGSYSPSNPLDDTRHNHRDYEKCVAATRTSVNVASKSEGRAILSLKIPPVVPSFHCSIIDVEYCIIVRILTGSVLGTSMKVEFPLIVGTVPIDPMRAATVTPAVAPTVPQSAPVKTEGAIVYPSAPPPSYEESTFHGKPEDSEPFAPRYPVYNNLPPYIPPPKPEIDELELPTKM